MASRKKGNGVNTINDVVEAAKKSRVDLRKFFEQALGRSEVGAELTRFQNFRTRGAGVGLQYEVPRAVIDHAREVNSRSRKQYSAA